MKQQEAEEKIKSGIILPDSAKEKPQEAVVVAVGSGKTHFYSVPSWNSSDSAGSCPAERGKLNQVILRCCFLQSQAMIR